ncbi:hypothetical protein SZ63_06205 [Methanoculleus sediminis]|uniref:Uncharacterized protein n=1 Tax=Methanoculleus sediminis TaxID=1550566 RepID=A0A0H1R7G5_9EURY|nr:hypothetical protein [Methanoculleus sediminis]KLK88592.1 hypothetical protein SZ63_06205 [Methanoculleus sediminis]
MKINEKAVSEAIGFVLILGIVISGIGLVTLYGYPVLVKEQSNTDVRNMERAMIVIQNDMKSLCFKNVPYKETSLQVSGGTFEVINASDYGGFINVTNGTADFQQDYYLGALTYRSDRGTGVITLENGAVMMRQEWAAGSAMLAEPRWFYDDELSERTFVIYIMNVTADTYMAKSGMTTVRMSLEDSSTQTIPVPGGNVTVEYTSGSSGDYSTAWENYLTGTSVGMQRTAPNNYERENVDKLVIKEYRIKIYDI